MMTTTIREKPILFSAPMVRAILSGQKTQTRRLIKPEHVDGLEIDDAGGFAFMHSPTCGGGCDYACTSAGEVVDGHIGWTPWGSNPKHWGRLWVRETFASIGSMRPAGYFSNPQLIGKDYWYKASDCLPTWGGPWKPSIFMPRSASRITLEITDIRVERVQDIENYDAMAEGFPGERWDEGHGNIGEHEPREQFRELWDKLNGPRGFGWESNPWVWVLEFRRIEP